VLVSAIPDTYCVATPHLGEYRTFSAMTLASPKNPQDDRLFALQQSRRKMSQQNACARDQQIPFLGGKRENSFST